MKIKPVNTTDYLKTQRAVYDLLEDHSKNGVDGRDAALGAVLALRDFILECTSDTHELTKFADVLFNVNDSTSGEVEKKETVVRASSSFFPSTVTTSEGYRPALTTPWPWRTFTIGKDTFVDEDEAQDIARRLYDQVHEAGQNILDEADLEEYHS